MVRIINRIDQSEDEGHVILQDLRETYTRGPTLPTKRTAAQDAEMIITIQSPITSGLCGPQALLCYQIVGHTTNQDTWRKIIERVRTELTPTITTLQEVDIQQHREQRKQSPTTRGKYPKAPGDMARNTTQSTAAEKRRSK
jgi:hypothetical protein